MCFSAKASISAWWILVFMALFLWYRNQEYDRAISIFIITLGLIQLIEYGIHSGADPNQSGQALFITLWLQCLVLAIGVFIYTANNKDQNNASQQIVTDIAGWNLFIFSVLFSVFLIVSMINGNNYSGVVGKGGHIEWSWDNGSLLGSWGWLYLAGLFFPLFLLFAFYSFADIGIALLIIYAALSAAYVLIYYPPEAFSSMWCYLSVGFAFLAWMIGIIPPETCLENK